MDPSLHSGVKSASVFWVAHGTLFINYLHKRKTINSEYYMALLVRFRVVASSFGALGKFRNPPPPIHPKKVVLETVNLTSLLRRRLRKMLQSPYACYGFSASGVRNCENTTPNEEKKSALSSRQCTASQVGRNNGKIARVTFRIVSLLILFSLSSSQ